MDSSDLIKKLIRSGESNKLDYKREQYKFIKSAKEEKSELLKDILAFANAWRSETAYILIGYDEEHQQFFNIDEKSDIDDAQVQQFINEKTNTRIEFSYRRVEHENYMLGLFTIPVQDDKKPFYIKKDYETLKANLVYVRRGSSTAIATPDEIAEMGEQKSTKYNNNANLSISLHDAKTSQAIDGIQFEYKKYEVMGKYPEFIGENASRITNQSYYREVANYIKDIEGIVGISFVLKNSGTSVIRNIKIHLQINEGDISVISNKNQYPNKPSKISSAYNLPIRIPEQTTKWSFEKTSDSWRAIYCLEKIYTSETITIPLLYIRSPKKSMKELRVEIFSDDFPESIKKIFPVSVKVTEEDLTYEKLLIVGAGKVEF